MLKQVRQVIHDFIASESTAGLILAAAAVLALVISNSPWGGLYESFVQLPGELRLGGNWLVLSKPLVVWVNDLWMAIFFFLVGLEIKRELLEGELSSLQQSILPAGAALGGMVVPGLIYAGLNWSDPVALRGWAIPMATDIAFALGILMLLGRRVPASLMVFLTAVAIIDDLGAIIVIAVFYTADLSLNMLLAAAAGVVLLAMLNRLRVTAIGPYAVVGLIVWVCVLKSGVHATLAGVVTALSIPLSDGKGGSPLREVEHSLHPWVAYAVLPLFAFVNAGVSLQGVSWGVLVQNISVGIVGGLLFGKTLGVALVSWLLIRFAGARLPAQSSWPQFIGVCALCGVGFTMSLFIGGLGFEGLGSAYEVQVKLGVLLGSLVSGATGTTILLRASPRRVSTLAV